MSSRVFVIQEPLRKNREGRVERWMDLTPAEDYGDLVFILNWGDAAKLEEDEIVWKLRAALNDFTENDYMLFVGSPSVMWVAGAIAAEQTDGVVRSLEWDRVKNKYFIKHHNLHAQPPRN